MILIKIIHLGDQKRYQLELRYLNFYHKNQIVLIDNIIILR